MEFPINSAMAAHMETAGCLNVDETGMYSLVLNFDMANAFIVPSLIGYLDGRQTRDKVPSKEEHYDTVSDCYNCPRPRYNRSFGALKGLANHLKDPMYDIKVYRCPNEDCDSRFATMGALLKHVEESECRMDFVNGVGGMATAG